MSGEKSVPVDIQFGVVAQVQLQLLQLPIYLKRVLNFFIHVVGQVLLLAELLVLAEALRFLVDIRPQVLEFLVKVLVQVH